MTPLLPSKVGNQSPLVRGMKQSKQTKQNQNNHTEKPLPQLKYLCVIYHTPLDVGLTCLNHNAQETNIPSATQSAHYAVNQTQAI